MRIVVHDYSGHPGQVHLSRALARRGHTVVHQYCASYVTGRGALERVEGDPAGLVIEPLSLASSFARYTMRTRVRQEITYGGQAARAILAAAPDVALLSNIPLLSLLVAARRLRRAGVPFVFWQQDVYSAAIGAVAVGRLGAVGRLIGGVAEGVERHVAQRSASVVPISDSFVPKLTAWGLSDDRITVIPNWAPLDELPERPRDNAWAVAHDLVGRRVVLYAGTLGLKHDPLMLSAAADALREAATIVVVSEGLGRQVLERERVERGLDNLMLLDFQPYADLPDMLGSADVVVALLERDASKYSLPSKVLTYLCVGRPIVAVIPDDNAVAQMVSAAHAGTVVSPGDAEGFVAALRALLDDPAARAERGRNARRFAEHTFDIERIAARFEDVLRAAVAPDGAAAGEPSH